MLRLLTARLVAAVPLVFAVATLVFFLAQANSADPAGSILGLDASPEAIEAKRAEFGIDKPLLSQYGDWLANAVRGDRETCLRVGMDDYLSKPLRLDALYEHLSRWLAL